MNKIKLPFLTAKAFRISALSLSKHLNPTAQKVGAPPGTLTYTGQESIESKINFHQYNGKEISFQTVESIEGIENKLSKNLVNWIEVTGLHDLELIKQIGSLFKIDQLTLEDILNVSQIPKIEGHENYLFVTLKLVDLNVEENTFDFTHFSLIILDDVLITFSEKPNKHLQHIGDHLKKSIGKLRNSNIEYLSYRIIDTIVDNYYYTLEWFANILSDLELELVENPSKKHINIIITFKKQWMILRKVIFPFKDAIRKMVNLEPKYMKSAGKHYIADLSDHLQSIGESMEIMRESLNNMMDLYSSTLSNKMNEVMQVLTIVSTIFIPLTFIAGIYGMNFEKMPELSWENGYFYTLGAMLVVGIAMAIYMKTKKWL